MANIIDYLEKNDIKWFPCEINEKKEPTYTGDKDGYMPKADDFQTLTDIELKQRQKIKSDFIVIDTSKVFQIDVDIPKGESTKFVECSKGYVPYYKSISKRQPHFFINLMIVLNS